MWSLLQCLGVRVHGIQEHCKRGLLSLLATPFPLLPTHLKTRAKSCHVDWLPFQLQETNQQVSRQIVTVLIHFRHQSPLCFPKRIFITTRITSLSGSFAFTTSPRFTESSGLLTSKLFLATILTPPLFIRKTISLHSPRPPPQSPCNYPHWTVVDHDHPARLRGQSEGLGFYIHIHTYFIDFPQAGFSKTILTHILKKLNISIYN